MTYLFFVYILFAKSVDKREVFWYIIREVKKKGIELKMKNKQFGQSKSCVLFLFDTPIQLSAEKDEATKREKLQELINLSPKHISFKSISELARFMATIDNAIHANSAWNIITRKFDNDIKCYLEYENSDFAVKKFVSRKHNREDIPYTVAGYNYYIVVSDCEAFSIEEEKGVVDEAHKIVRTKSKHIAAIKNDLDYHTVDGKEINYYQVRKVLREEYPDLFLWKIGIRALKNMKRDMPKQISESVFVRDENAKILNNIRYYEMNHRGKKYKWYDLDDFFERMNIKQQKRKSFLRVMGLHTTPHGENYIFVVGKNAKAETLLIEETQLYAVCVNWNETFRNMVCGKILPSINNTGKFDVQQLKQEKETTDVDAVTVPVEVNSANTLPDIANNTMISAEIVNKQAAKITSILNRYHDYHGCLTPVDMDYLNATKPALHDIIIDTVVVAKGLKLRKNEDCVNIYEKYHEFVEGMFDCDDDYFNHLVDVIMTYTCLGALDFDNQMSLNEKVNLINKKSSSFSIQNKKCILSRQAIWDDVLKKFEKNVLDV